MGLEVRTGEGPVSKVEDRLRKDLGVTKAWLRSSRSATVLVVLVLVGGGILSAVGLMKWDSRMARWSFATVAWVFAVWAAVAHLTGRDR